MDQQQLCEACQSKNVCIYTKAFRDMEKNIAELLSGTFVPHNDEKVDLGSIFHTDLRCDFFVKIAPSPRPSGFESYLMGNR